MKAKTQYTDLIGTAAADITDFGTKTNSLDDLSKKFGIDETKLKLIGISVFGFPVPEYVRLICIDLIESKKQNIKKTITITPPEKFEDSLSNFFKRTHFVLYDKFDEEHPSIENSGEYNWDDFMSE